MSWMRSRPPVGIAAGMLAAFLFGQSVLAGDQKERPYRHSDVDMPVSLSVGTVRTPQFATAAEWYDIMVQVEKPLPPLQMRCMMGLTLGPLDAKDCTSDDPLLRADWTVLDGDYVVARGSTSNRAAGKFEDKHMYRFLGSFPAEGGKKYVVEVRFAKDGTLLNVAKPHLIVIRHEKN